MNAKSYEAIWLILAKSHVKFRVLPGKAYDANGHYAIIFDNDQYLRDILIELFKTEAHFHVLNNSKGLILR